MKPVRILFWCSVLGIGILMGLPGDMLAEDFFDWWDKAQHALAFGLLALLGLAAYPTVPMRLTAGLAGYGAATELMQAFLPWRSGDVLDFIADVLGVVLVMVALRWRGCSKPASS